MTTLDAPPPARHRPPALLRGWLFFLVTAVAVLGGAAAHVVTRPVTWSAQSVIAFVPVGERPVSATSVTLMVPRYVAYAASPYVVRQAAAAVGVPSTELQGGLNVTMPATTANVAITVSGRSAAVAAEAANRIAALVVERASADPVLAARMLAEATVPTSPAGPGESTLLGGAAVGALVVGAFAACGVRWYVRRRYPPVTVPVVPPSMRRPGPDTVLGTAALPRPVPPEDTVEMPPLEEQDTVDFDPATVVTRSATPSSR
ncbi:hypothetical protein [Cryptosporangium aurantiacum]|uniref:Capsular polysaccharide biosynthesis protein n=1 Tax=Cryptosporangium aurantiacum TaxID=134849 RepID=A0A1M7RJL2_9ACTN|nr:hypothetical protein [Cryptosporangium aurantiacum]SHN46362.1 Capsular polysaccharide biosynthesis protein [Cryptosporangium aurantiacum]